MPAFAQSSGSVLEGDWNGDLHVGSQTLRLHLVIPAGPQATLFSIDQGNAPIPAQNVRIDGVVISMTFPAVNARFTGSLVEGRIGGTFTQGRPFPLIFARGAASTTPPAPSPPRLQHLTQRPPARPARAQRCAGNGRRRTQLLAQRLEYALLH